MSNHREPFPILRANGKPAAFLEYAGAYEPSWAHPRAEMQLCYHELRLPGREPTRGRFFTHRCAARADGAYLAIEEYDTDGTPESFDRVDVRLVIIATERAEEAIACRQRHGTIEPGRFEPDKILYRKLHLDWAGVVHRFECSLAGLCWGPIRFPQPLAAPPTD